MVWAVTLLPVPAMIFARLPMTPRTTRSSSTFSSSVVVGDSPVVPETTSMSLPSSTRWFATFSTDA